MAARWMLYSYDALGLGHVRRTLSIARSVLADRQDVGALLATCSPQIDALPVPPGLDYIKLPSARKVGNHHYVPRTLRLDAERLRAMRTGILLDAARWFEPDLMLVDKSPTGLMGELGPSLDLLRGGRARLVLGWRDILDAPRRVLAEWRDLGTLGTLERLYEEIWVYGDPAVFDVREAYHLPDRLAERVRYLGYLAPQPDPVRRAQARAQIARNGAPVAVVTAGGGEDGEALLSCYLETARLGHLPDGLASLVVTGPFMPDDAQRRLCAVAPEGVTVTPFLSGLDGAIAAADVVVSTAGYNTVCEVLGSGTPAVLVPRIGHRDEQRMRAARLATLGLVEYLPLSAIEPRELAAAVRRALGRGRLRPPSPWLDGLDRVVHEVRRLLPAPTDRRSAAVAPAPEPAAELALGGARP